MKEEKLNDAQRQMLAALRKLRDFQLTPEEERVLDEFEEFQRQHPISFSSLDLESIEDEERQAAIRSVALKSAARRLKDDI
jgi:RNase adaptor protein for sRNA GlmZ degradation